MRFKPFAPLPAASLAFVLSAWAAEARALTTNWNTTSSGFFADALNWDNGVPHAADTAVFREGAGAAYTVTFLGGNPIGGGTTHFQTDRLVVGNNDVTFAKLFLADYAALNSTTAESGRGIVVGELGGVVEDVATLTTKFNVTGTAATIGDAVAAAGTLNIAAGTFTLTGGNGFTDSTLIVGNRGIGAVNVTAGAKLSFTSTSSYATLGNHAGSNGAATVSGAGSNVSVKQDLYVGNDGVGSLRIQDGGAVGDAQAFIGLAQSHLGANVSTGSARVVGPGSTWTHTVGMIVGESGGGSLSIESGGSVAGGFAGVIALNPGSTGSAFIRGEGSSWTIAGLGSYLAIGGFPNQTATGVEFHKGGAGSLSIETGGTMAVDADVYLFSDGQLNLAGGTLSAARVSFEGGGLFKFTSGALNVGVYNGDLFNLGGALAPGLLAARTTTVVGSYAQATSGALQLQIGAPPGVGNDLVHVTDFALLSGNLQLAMLNNFVPSSSQSFTVLTADDGVFGAFANVADGQRLATVDGLGSFIVHYGAQSTFGANQLVLTSFLLGADFDEDGDVDADDLTKWKTGFGTAAGATHMQGDANSDGDVDGADFSVWQNELGAHAAVAADATSSTSVPEPLAFTLAALVPLILRRVRFSRGLRPKPTRIPPVDS